MLYIKKNTTNTIPVLYIDRSSNSLSFFDLFFNGRQNNITKTVRVQNVAAYPNYALLILTESNNEDLQNGIITLDVGEYYVDVLYNGVKIKSLIAKVVDNTATLNEYSTNTTYAVYE